MSEMFFYVLSFFLSFKDGENKTKEKREERVEEALGRQKVQKTVSDCFHQTPRGVKFSCYAQLGSAQLRRK